MKRRLSSDDILAEGLTIEGFALAGSPAAFDLFGPHEVIHCVRCGARISYVLATSKGPMGGDCYATLTGDQTTRKQWRKIQQGIEKALAYHKRISGVVVEHRPRGSVLSLSTSSDSLDEWTGQYYPGQSWFLGEVKGQALAEAIAASISDMNGWPLEVQGAQKNPLDPYAFDTEPHPFIVPSRGKRREEHVGVHTTSTMEQAAVYAVQRAMIQGDTVAIIFEIDVAGLTPFPDVDATIQSIGETDLLDELRSAMEDADDVSEAVEKMVDMFMDQDDDMPPDTWVDGATQWVDRAQRYAAVGALKNVEDLEERAENNFADGLPDLFWADVVDQRRFMEPIGLDRITRVFALRPVRNKLWGQGDVVIEDENGDEVDEEEMERNDEYAPDVPGESQIMARSDFYDERFLPDVIELYNRGRKPVEAQYHGTDLTRARKAFPELDLQNPWGYTQES